jgi:hypothetical protein
MTFLRRSAIPALILTLLAVCVISLYSYELKRRVDDVVAVAYELSLKGQPPTIQDLRQRFGSALRQPDPCTPDGCGYDLFLSNRVLAAVHLVPYSALRSSFWARNGVIDVNSLEFWTMARPGTMVLSYIVVRYCDHCDSFSIHPWEDSAWWGTTGSVEIGSASTANNKRIALALDTECLTRLRGCANIAEIFPKLWQQTPARNISCRIPNHEGVVDKMPNSH